MPTAQFSCLLVQYLYSRGHWRLLWHGIFYPHLALMRLETEELEEFTETMKERYGQ